MYQAFFHRRMYDSVFFSISHPSVLSTARRALTIIAGLAANWRPLPVAAAACCTAPWGGSYCPGAGCTSTGACTGYCEPATGYCYSYSNGCWCSLNCSNTRCCDCFCTPTPFVDFFCYCTGCTDSCGGC